MGMRVSYPCVHVTDTPLGADIQEPSSPVWRALWLLGDIDSPALIGSSQTHAHEHRAFVPHLVELSGKEKKNAEQLS